MFAQLHMKTRDFLKILNSFIIINLLNAVLLGCTNSSSDIGVKYLEALSEKKIEKAIQLGHSQTDLTQPIVVNILSSEMRSRNIKKFKIQNETKESNVFKTRIVGINDKDKQFIFDVILEKENNLWKVKKIPLIFATLPKDEDIFKLTLHREKLIKLGIADNLDIKSTQIKDISSLGLSKCIHVETEQFIEVIKDCFWSSSPSPIYGLNKLIDPSGIGLIRGIPPCGQIDSSTHSKKYNLKSGKKFKLMSNIVFCENKNGEMIGNENGLQGYDNSYSSDIISILEKK